MWQARHTGGTYPSESRRSNTSLISSCLRASIILMNTCACQACAHGPQSSLEHKLHGSQVQVHIVHGLLCACVCVHVCVCVCVCVCTGRLLQRLRGPCVPSAYVHKLLGYLTFACLCFSWMPAQANKHGLKHTCRVHDAAVHRLLSCRRCELALAVSRGAHRHESQHNKRALCRFTLPWN